MRVGERQWRTRVLEALERRAKQFRSREALWPLRVPHDPVPLHDVIEQALGDDARYFEPLTLRSRPLIWLEWRPQPSLQITAEAYTSPKDEDWPPKNTDEYSRMDHAATWEAFVIVLPSRVKLYCDTDGEETRILASGGRNAGDESDRLFLRLLSESAGRDFGIEMGGEAPTRVRSSIADREFLVDVFVNLFEVAGLEESVRRDLAAQGLHLDPARDVDGVDFRSDVERWLQQVM